MNNSNITSITISKTHQLSPKKATIITFVGAGGKTTSLLSLADALSQKGYRVLATTTTHMMRLDYPKDQLLEKEDSLMLQHMFQNHTLVGLGIPMEDQPAKWRSPSLAFLKDISDIPDFILCEGDGSKCLPIKVPRQKEPVLYPDTNLIVGIIGLSSFHKPIHSTMFGYDSASKEIKKELSESTLADLITLDTYKLLATKDYGLQKLRTQEDFCLILNQADLLSEEDRPAFEKFISDLNTLGISSHLCGRKNLTSILLRSGLP